MSVTEQPDDKILRTDQNISPPTQDSVNFEQIQDHGSSGEEVENGQNHPLLNDVILRRIFQKQKTTDFLVYRTVCKKWNLSTIPFIRSKFYLNISHDNMRDFVQIFNASDLGISFSKFRIGSFGTTDRGCEQFIDICGDAVRDLNFFDGNFYIEDVSEILRFTPNLETFEIPQKIYSHSAYPVKLFPDDVPKPKLSALTSLRICQDFSIIRYQSCPTFFEELFTAAENVSSLYLCDLLPVVHIQDSTTLEVLSVIEKLGRESSIKNLYISHVRSEHVEILRRMVSKENGLKLRKLDCKTESVMFRNVDSVQFVQIFKNTLQYLNFKDNSTCFQEFPKFSKFPRLKDLTINGLTGFNSRGVKLNKKFPVLQQLSLYTNYDTLREFFPDSEPSKSVASLELHYLIIKINAFNKILTIFPKLTELRLNVAEDGVEILRLICSRMTQLKKLCVAGSIPTETETTDSLLTGIPIETIQNNPDMLNGLDEMTPELRRETIFKIRSQHSQLPSIVSLTNLRYLELYLSVGGVEGIWTHMTDMSGYLAFYSKKPLTVYLGRCKFTETCRQILRSETELDCRF